MTESIRTCHLKKSVKKIRLLQVNQNILEKRKIRLDHKKKQFISGKEQEANQLPLQIRPILSGSGVNAPLNGIPSDKQKGT